MPEALEEIRDRCERLKLRCIAPGRKPSQKAARNTDECLRLLHVTQLRQVLRLGLTLTLYQDLVRALDVIQGGAVTVVAGRADEPERHVVLHRGLSDIKDVPAEP